MKKLILLLFTIILVIDVNAQKIELTSNHLFIGFQLNASYPIERVVLNATYNHERRFDNFLFGGGYTFFDGIIEAGLKAGIGNEKFSSAIYTKANFSLNEKLDFVLMYGFYQNSFADSRGMSIFSEYYYPAINFGLAYKF